ncbi:MAG: 3'(2'),5'-bisphosphate nucleotidase CysQ [Pseudomonadota bacterium]
MPATDLPLLIDAVRSAGRVATSYRGDLARRWDKPGGAGPVTEADIAVNDLLRTQLELARPGYGWLSEETEDGTARLRRDAVFIIDPIDGTRSFAKGQRTWAISVGIAERGVVTAGVVFLPARGMLYAAARGRGAWLNGAPLTVSEQAGVVGAEVLAAKPIMAPEHWPGGVPEVVHAYRPSLAYRLGLVAQGRFDGMFTFRPSWEWDIAAGSLIVEEAGGTVTDKTGAPLRFNNAHPALNGVVAATPGVHASAMAALKHV